MLISFHISTYLRYYREIIILLLMRIALICLHGYIFNQIQIDFPTVFINLKAVFFVLRGLVTDVAYFLLYSHFILLFCTSNAWGI